MKAIEHGTRRGYQQHKARRVMVCPKCEDANREYMTVYQRKTYDPAKRRARYLRAKAAGYYDRVKESA